MKHPEAIAVLDFGGQYAHLIATKVRALGVYAEIRDPDEPVDDLAHYRGFILSGSPSLSSHDEDAAWSRKVMELGRPVMGFCFGHQEIAKYHGGEVEHTKREYGAASLHLCADSPLFKDLDSQEVVWMSHGDTVTRLPEGFVEIGYTTSGGSDEPHHFAAIADERRRMYGLQFHPEVDDTPHGQLILRNFAVEICGLKPNWFVGDQLPERVEELRRRIGEQRVLLLASGGVDSTVTALLLGRAVGPGQLQLLHIDNGLMRRDESRHVAEMLGQAGLGSSLRVVDASEEFLEALAGLTDPEAKRRAIGDTFISIFEREARALGIEDALLAQGTIYPDTIETGGSRRADTIKTHHNRVPVVEEMIAAGRVIEPLADLYKSEVRELGRALGLDPRLIGRHPFPGPGLGIRLACAGREEAGFQPESLAEPLTAALSGSGLRGLALPVRSVGVKGDLRAYEHPVLVSGSAPPWERLLAVANGVTKQVPGVNRCLLWLGPGQGPATVQHRPATVSGDRLELLREFDALVMGELERHGLMETIWQCPTVLVPLSLDGRGSELVVLRPIHSERAMTARPAWPGEELVASVLELAARHDQIAGVALDVTSKPPATIEWE